jgi:hypothetical protein
MSIITLAQVESALGSALSLVQEFAPLAALGGPAAGAIGTLVGDLAGAASAIVAQVTSDESIIASGDVTTITALQQQLEAQNTALQAQIAAS